jgi:hypothetical protein
LAPELLDEYGGIATDPDGKVVIVGLLVDDGEDVGVVAVARTLANGAPDPDFGGGDGVADTTIAAVRGSGLFSVGAVDVLGDGSIVAVGQRRSVPGDPFSNALWALKLTSTGSPAGGYGAGGIAIEEEGFTSGAPRGGIASDGSAVVVQGGLGGGFFTAVSAGGVFDNVDAADSGVPACTLPTFPGGVVPVSPTEFVWAYQSPLYNGTGCNPIEGGPDDAGTLVVVRQTTAGALVWAESIRNGTSVNGNGLGPNQAVSLAGGSVFIGGRDLAGAPRVVRVDPTNGDPIAGWGAGGTATLAAGNSASTVVALSDGRFASITNPDDTETPVEVDVMTVTGFADPTAPRFTASSSQPGAGLRVSDIASSGDGLVVLGRSSADEGQVRRYEWPASTVPDIASIEPRRYLDTRADGTTFDGVSQGGGAVGPAGSVKVRIAGRGEVPAGASAAVLNVTAVFPEGPGFLTVYPCTDQVPNASSVNYQAGTVVANGVTAKLSAEGDVCVYSLARAHVLIDVGGFLPAGTDVTPIAPARYLETRSGDGNATFDGVSQGGGAVGPAGSVKVRIAGRGEVPAGASAAVLNVTAVFPEGPGFLTVYPCTDQVPNASSVNYFGNDVVANNVIAKLDASGDVCVYSLARAHVLIDVGGYVSAPPA